MKLELEAAEIGLACAKQVAPEAVAATEGFFAEICGKLFGSRKARDAVVTVADKVAEASTREVSIPFIHPPRDNPSRIFASSFFANSTEAKVYEKASAAVVRITGTTVKEEAGKLTKGVHFGTGFILKDDIIATNYHVVKDSLMVPPQIALKDGTKLSCQLIARDKIADLALLKITDKPASLVLEHLDLAPKGQGILGSPVFTVGHPGGVMEATMGSGKAIAMERWDANEALELSGNKPFQQGYAKMKKLLDYSSELWDDKNPQSIRNAVVYKVETSVPSLGGNSGSPVLDSNGSVRAILSHGRPSGAYNTHVDHLHAMLNELPNRQLKESWLDVFTKGQSLSGDAGKIKVIVTRTQEAPWSKAIGIFSERLERIKSLLSA